MFCNEFPIDSFHDGDELETFLTIRVIFETLSNTHLFSTGNESTMHLFLSTFLSISGAMRLNGS